MKVTYTRICSVGWSIRFVDSNLIKSILQPQLSMYGLKLGEKASLFLSLDHESVEKDRTKESYLHVFNCICRP